MLLWVYYMHSYTILLSRRIIGFIYTYIGVGLSRCSFRLTGQCEGLYCVERATGIGSTFEPKYRIYSFDNQTRKYGNIMK